MQLINTNPKKVSIFFNKQTKIILIVPIKKGKAIMWGFI